MLNKVEIIKKIEAVKSDSVVYDFCDLRDIAGEYQIGEDLFDDYIEDMDLLAEIAIENIFSHGITGLLNFLNDIDEDAFYVDGIVKINKYRCLKRINNDDIQHLKNKLIELVNELEGDGDD